MYIHELPMFVYNFIGELFTPRYIMSMIVSNCQHCDEQQF